MPVKQNWLYIWGMIDPIYFQFTRLNYVKNALGDRTIIRVRLTKYKGAKIILSDGTIINKNDLLLKIHLHNVKLLRKIINYPSDIRRALTTYKLVEESLPFVSHYIKGHQKREEIKGIIGITTLYKGSERLGFDVFPLKNKWYKRFKQIALFPIFFLSAEKISKEMTAPMYLIMSKKVLEKKYSKN